MPGTIKNRLVRKQLLTCDYDELSENNLFNQIIKTTVMLLLRNAKVKAEYKDDLKKKMLFFSNVDILEPTSIQMVIYQISAKQSDLQDAYKYLSADN